MEELIYNGFRYFSNYGKGELPKVEHGWKTPEYLFKYYSFGKYSIDALINNYLYASHPYELNDILDSSRFLYFTSKPIPIESYERLYFHENKVFKSKEELINFYNVDVENYCSEYLSHCYNIASKYYGVVSLSKEENNILMWPHYTQEKGFQVKLNSAILIKSVSDKLSSNDRFIGLFPMNYTSKIQPVDVYNFRRFDIPLIYSTNVKLDSWDYEKEWRLFVSKPEMGIPFRKLGFSDIENHKFDSKKRFINYGIDAIESICLGMNFFSGTDFSIQWIDEMKFEVQPRKEQDEYDWYLKFLKFIVEIFSEKIYLSGIKYEMDLYGNRYLIRTKERVCITRVQGSKYLIERTEEIIKFI